MNALDDLELDRKAFAYRDLLGQDLWDSFTPTFSLTAVGTPVYTGRYRLIGRKCEFQVKAVPGTSIATTAGTSYMTLPSTAKGLAGWGVMQNSTTLVAVGNCVVDVATSRLYLPTQGASGNTFLFYGEFEVSI